MTIFAIEEHIEKIERGDKWHTRRLVKDGTTYDCNDAGEIVAIRINGKVKYRVGNIYSAQPGRGKKGLVKFKVKALRVEDARAISPEDAIAEGGYDPQSYMCLWAAMYDKSFRIVFDERVNSYLYPDGKEDWNAVDADNLPAIQALYNRRPNALYQCNVIVFEVVK